MTVGDGRAEAFARLLECAALSIALGQPMLPEYGSVCQDAAQYIRDLHSHCLELGDNVEGQ